MRAATGVHGRRMTGQSGVGGRGTLLTNVRSLALSASVALFGLALPAHAKDLTVAYEAAPTSMDPYYHNVTANNATIMHMIEPLVFAEAGERMSPGLALSWTAIDDTTWEFKLRPGVKFSDGSDQTIGAGFEIADDEIGALVSRGWLRTGAMNHEKR